MTRLKDVAVVVAGQSPPSAEVKDFLDDLPFLQGNAEFGLTSPTPRLECADPPKTCEPDDLLISVRAPVGALNVADTRYGIGRGLCAIRPVNIHARFLWWWMQHSRTSLRAVAVGSTFDAVTAGVLGSAAVPDLRFDDQCAVANYLDHETARIDALITKQSGLVAGLHERKDALIDREFAGANGKRTTTVRRVLRPMGRPAIPGAGVVTAYRDGTVTLRSKRRADGYTMSETEAGYQAVLVGDLVFHALDGFAGAVGIADSEGNATPVYHVCDVLGDDVPAYVALLLRYLGRSGYLATQAPNVRQRSVDFRNWGTFARISLTLPTPEHQHTFLNRLYDVTVKLDVLIAKAEQFIDLVKERRAALITAAVTGQIDVREGRPDG